MSSREDGGALDMAHFTIGHLPLNKRSRTSADEQGESELTSLASVDVDAIVDEVLRDDVEHFALLPEAEGSCRNTNEIKYVIATAELEGENDGEGEGEGGPGALEFDGEYYYYQESEEATNDILNLDQEGSISEDDEDSCADSSDHDDSVSHSSETTSIPLSAAASEMIQEVMNLGPNLYVQKKAADPEANPMDILGPLGFSCPEGLLRADTSAQWAYVKRILLKYVYERPRLGLSTIQDVVQLLERSRKIMVVTGAGISVSCGIPDFRSENGLYARIQREYALPEPECMFDIQFFRIDPEPFYSFARELLPRDEFKASFSHHFIADLERRGQLLRQYTQNIDTLEENAGIKQVIYCHGSFASASCLDCQRKLTFEQFKIALQMDGEVPLCAACSGVIKPDIVFFGEPLPKTFDDHLEVDCTEVDLLLVIGSSMKVHPVSSIPDLIPPHVPQILINRESLDHNFDIELLGDCDIILAELQRLLGRSFDDAQLQERFAHLTNGQNSVSSTFIEPIYHVFPGAKYVEPPGEPFQPTIGDENNLESPVHIEDKGPLAGQGEDGQLFGGDFGGSDDESTIILGAADDDFASKEESSR